MNVALKQTADTDKGAKVTFGATAGMPGRFKGNFDYQFARTMGSTSYDGAGLDRLGRDKSDALRLGQRPFLLGLWCIPVPFHDGDSHVLAKLVQALELVIDKRLQGTDIQHGKSQLFPVCYLRENRQERGFRIRHYGLFANGHRADMLNLCRTLLDTPSPSTAPNNSGDGDPPDTTNDLRICPCCGGRMKIIETFDSPYASQGEARHPKRFDSS
jgi:hypothetical protein